MKRSVLQFLALALFLAACKEDGPIDDGRATDQVDSKAAAYANTALDDTPEDDEFFRVYADSQSYQFSGICVGCKVENPEKAIGRNLDDYSTLKIGLGVLGKVQQTLLFPDQGTIKLAIEIGTDDIPLTVELLKGITIETVNDGKSNNDAKAIDASILKIGSNTPTRATILLYPDYYKEYDGVKITLDGGLLILNGGLRVYGAYFLDHQYSECGNLIPEDPVAYYGMGGFNSPTMVCGGGARNLDARWEEFKFSARFPEIGETMTMSFWAKINGSIIIRAYGMEILLNPTNGSITRKGIKKNIGYATFGEMSFFKIVCARQTIYKDIVEIRVNAGRPDIAEFATSKFDSGLETETIALSKAEIDEFVIHDKIISPKTEYALRCIHGMNQLGCSKPTVASAKRM
ncbi:MAG: C-terminal target protein [Sphingobacterium sp.]|jgi:hypothetical protein|nr:C-terminal target protein [Sphingobacterium sp.]